MAPAAEGRGRALPRWPLSEGKKRDHLGWLVANPKVFDEFIQKTGYLGAREQMATNQCKSNTIINNSEGAISRIPTTRIPGSGNGGLRLSSVPVSSTLAYPERDYE